MSLRIFVVFLTVLLIVSCSGDGGNENGVTLPTVPVKTIITQRGTLEVTREFTGGLVGIKQADIYFRTSEAVVVLPYKEGDFVRKDAEIIKLDRSGASSNYYQAKAAHDNALSNFNKMKNLYEQGAISETQFDNSKAIFKVARANFKAASEMVLITAPISGQLVDLNVDVGDIPHVGQLAARIARTDTLRLDIAIPDDLIGSFSVAVLGKLTVSAVPGEYDCQVREVARAADPDTRTFSVGITVPNPDNLLRTGMFAKVMFVIEQRENVIAVDRAALLSTEGLYEVFVVERDTAYSRSVKIGSTNKDHIEISSGLNEGEEVVVLGQNFLSDGYPIIRAEDNENDSL